MVDEVKALREVSADNGKGTVLESVCISPKCSRDDRFFGTFTLHSIKLLGEQFHLSCASDEAMCEYHLHPPVKIRLKEDDRADFIDLDISYSF